MQNTAVIIFSKDGALQLEATLRSFLLQCRDPERGAIYVLYKASNRGSAAQYKILTREYPQVKFIPESNFRSLLTRLTKKH